MTPGLFVTCPPDWILLYVGRQDRLKTGQIENFKRMTSSSVLCRRNKGYGGALLERAT